MGPGGSEIASVKSLRHSVRGARRAASGSLAAFLIRMEDSMPSTNPPEREQAERPKRQKPEPRWGAGAIIIQGYGQTDNELAARGIVLDHRRGCRGLLHSDQQFAHLVKHLNVSDQRSLADIKVRLDNIRG